MAGPHQPRGHGRDRRHDAPRSVLPVDRLRPGHPRRDRALLPCAQSAPMADVLAELANDTTSFEVVGERRAARRWATSSSLKESADEAPVVRLVNMILADAIRRGRLRHPPGSRTRRSSASGSASTACCTRSWTPPKRLEAAIISRAQDHGQPGHRRAPRCPRTAASSCAAASARSTSASRRCPTIFGEKAVHPDPRQGGAQLDLRAARLRPVEPGAVQPRRSTSPYGMVLITGPTGSGKTTTLYSAIHTINTPDTTS